MTDGLLPPRRWLVPEVIQTSAMDCGPAVLKSLLEGFGIPVDYGRLREACQTDVDGTSISVLEETAVRLGLAAEQVMLPRDHLLLPEAEALPAILVVRLPSGLTHFVLVWRRPTDPLSRSWTQPSAAGGSAADSSSSRSTSTANVSLPRRGASGRPTTSRAARWHAG
jgi:ABC-type bacteriocin/lantibiotic exporter with double-glycine peptidase domain